MLGIVQLTCGVLKSSFCFAFLFAVQQQCVCVFAIPWNWFVKQVVHSDRFEHSNCCRKLLGSTNYSCDFGFDFQTGWKHLLLLSTISKMFLMGLRKRSHKTLRAHETCSWHFVKFIQLQKLQNRPNFVLTVI